MRKNNYHSVNNHGKSINMHTLIVERVLGRKLPSGVEVHHVDGNGRNNGHRNLVVCPSTAYHKLLHVRTKALEACGNANWLRCVRCKQWDDPARMYLYVPKDQKSPRAEHRECMHSYRKGGMAC